MKTLLCTISCLALVAAFVPTAGSTPADTTDLPIPPADSLSITRDSTSSVPDTTRPTETIPISQAERLKMMQEQERSRPTRFSFHDSLIVYFTSERQNQRASLARSFFHDAGDFLRFDPSYFGMDHQATPMRQTIQPFGLSGDRMNILINDRPLHPFEHILEPDGMIDFNDVPIGNVSDVYLLPGSLGQLFGASNSVASMILRPKSPESNAPETRLIVDKGSFAYNFVRGSYAKDFKRGREIDLSVEYRNADGIDLRRQDDAYQYYGDLYHPLSSNYTLKASGQLYDRQGDFVVQPDIGGGAVRRNRTDRSGRLSIEQADSTGHRVTEFGVQSFHQGVDLERDYNARLSVSGRALFASRQWIVGRTALAVSADIGQRKFNDKANQFDRKSGGVLARVATLQDGLRLGATLGTDYDEDFKFLPSASIVMTNETERWLFSLSAGYSERAPSLYELFLPGRKATIYGGNGDYADRGNPNLQSEKQAVANISLEYGSLQNNSSVSITGGKIFDGIDWKNSSETDIFGPFRLFMPVNGDINFVNITGQQQLSPGDWLHFRTGGSYHYVDYDAIEDKAYQPKYQGFAGTELHFWWPQRLMHLYAYAEAVYSSSYHGYDEPDLGEEVIINTKVSFSMKQFRFHFVIENLLNNNHRVRDFLTNPGQFSYYGFVWNFLD